MLNIPHFKNYQFLLKSPKYIYILNQLILFSKLVFEDTISEPKTRNKNNALINYYFERFKFISIVFIALRSI